MLIWSCNPPFLLQWRRVLLSGIYLYFLCLYLELLCSQGSILFLWYGPSLPPLFSYLAIISVFLYHPFSIQYILLLFAELVWSHFYPLLEHSRCLETPFEVWLATHVSSLTVSWRNQLLFGLCCADMYGCQVIGTIINCCTADIVVKFLCHHQLWDYRVDLLKAYRLYTLQGNVHFAREISLSLVNVVKIQFVKTTQSCAKKVFCLHVIGLWKLAELRLIH